MADETSNELFGETAPAPAPTVEQDAANDTKSFKNKARAFIDKHFPALEDGGVEAHQLHRAFALEMLDVL